MILKVLKIARAFRRVQFENFLNHEYLLFMNSTRRLSDFLFIVHSTKLRRFHWNLMGTPTEYNFGLIVLLSTNQNWVICWVYYNCNNTIHRSFKVASELVLFLEKKATIQYNTIQYKLYWHSLKRAFQWQLSKNTKIQ